MISVVTDSVLCENICIALRCDLFSQWQHSFYEKVVLPLAERLAYVCWSTKKLILSYRLQKRPETQSGTLSSVLCNKTELLETIVVVVQ